MCCKDNDLKQGFCNECMFKRPFAYTKEPGWTCGLCCNFNSEEDGNVAECQKCQAWSCLQCGMCNKSDVLACRMCKNPKDEPEESEANLSTETGPRWTCLRCTAINLDENGFCTGCDNMRGIWICDACDEMYTDDIDACEKCGKILERPPQPEEDVYLKKEESVEIIESVVEDPEPVAEEEKTPPAVLKNPLNWLCQFCGSENPQRRKACIACLKRRPDLTRVQGDRSPVKSFTTTESYASPQPTKSQEPSPISEVVSSPSPISEVDSSPSPTKPEEMGRAKNRAVTSRQSLTSTVEWWCRECEIWNSAKRKACAECYKSKARVCSAN